jgi:hypothetical protein
MKTEHWLYAIAAAILLFGGTKTESGCTCGH